MHCFVQVLILLQTKHTLYVLDCLSFPWWHGRLHNFSNFLLNGLVHVKTPSNLLGFMFYMISTPVLTLWLHIITALDSLLVLQWITWYFLSFMTICQFYMIDCLWYEKFIPIRKNIVIGLRVEGENINGCAPSQRRESFDPKLWTEAEEDKRHNPPFINFTFSHLTNFSWPSRVPLPIPSQKVLITLWP